MIVNTNRVGAILDRRLGREDRQLYAPSRHAPRCGATPSVVPMPARPRPVRYVGSGWRRLASGSRQGLPPAASAGVLPPPQSGAMEQRWPWRVPASGSVLVGWSVHVDAAKLLLRSPSSSLGRPHRPAPPVPGRSMANKPGGKTVLLSPGHEAASPPRRDASGPPRCRLPRPDSISLPRPGWVHAPRYRAIACPPPCCAPNAVDYAERYGQCSVIVRRARGSDRREWRTREKIVLARAIERTIERAIGDDQCRGISRRRRPRRSRPASAFGHHRRERISDRLPGSVRGASLRRSGRGTPQLPETRVVPGAPREIRGRGQAAWRTRAPLSI